MLIVANSVKNTRNAARFQFPATQDETVIKDVEQMAVDFLHTRGNMRRTKPFRHDSLDEIPSLFCVDEIA